MSEEEKTRRQTLKLAAAVAAFGTALGFRQTAEASGSTKTESKVDRLELKLYADDKMVHSCPVPQSAIKLIKLGARLEHKFYRNGRPV